MDQNVLKIRMLNRNIFPLRGNWKYNFKGYHIFMPKCPKLKTLKKKIMYTWNAHYQKEKENLYPMFSEKDWSRGKKTLFWLWYNSCCCFSLKKLVMFSHTSFHPQPKQHRFFTLYLCTSAWSIKTLIKGVHRTELQ